MDELIQDKYNEVNVTTHEIIDEIFKNLTDLISDPERNEKYLSDIQSLQKNIVDAWNIEREGLENLKSIAPPASLKQLSDILSDSKELQKIIDDKIKHLEEILNKK